MINQEKDPLAKFLFSSVVQLLILLVGVGLLLSASPGGAMLGFLGGVAIDKWLWLGDFSSLFAVLFFFVGLIGPMLGSFFLLSKIEKWEALKEKCAAWRFLDNATDILSAVIRGIGSVLLSSGLGAVFGGLVVLGVLLVKLYCNHVGIPFPSLPPNYWQTITFCSAFSGVLWQLRNEERTVTQ